MTIPSIALGLYSVYQELQTDIERTLYRVKQFGYKGVEFYGPFTHPPETIHQLLAKYALANCGWHTEWKLLQPDARPATVEYLLKSGTPTAIIPALGGPWEIGHTLAEDCRDIWIGHAQEMNLLSNRLKPHGLRLGYHTHAHEFETHFGDVTPWDLIRQHTKSDIILELDTGSCLQGGGDPIRALSSIPGRPLLVHCKPISRQAGHETYIGAPDDANDWSHILRQCKLAGTEWLVVEHESEMAYPQFDGAERCLQGIRRFL